MEIVLLLVTATLTIGNFFILMLVFFYINRNWEKLLELQNEISSIEYISKFGRGK